MFLTHKRGNDSQCCNVTSLTQVVKMLHVNETNEGHAYPYPMMGLKCHHRLDTDGNTHVYGHLHW